MKSNKKLAAIISVIAVVVILIVGGAIVLSGNRGIDINEQLILGEKYLEELDYDKAIAAYEAILEIEPQNKQAYKSIVDAYIAQGKYKEAYEYAEKGYDATSDADFVCEMLEIEQESGQTYGAGEVVSANAAELGGSTAAVEIISILIERVGDVDKANFDFAKALEIYEGILELDPTNEEAYIGIVEGYLQQGDYEKAQEYAKKGYEATGSQKLKDLYLAISKDKMRNQLLAETASLGLRVLDADIDEGVEIYELTNGVIITKANELYGAMNYNGEMLVPNEYTECVLAANKDGYFALKKDNAYYVFDSTGKEMWNSVEPREKLMSSFYEVPYERLIICDGVVIYNMYLQAVQDASDAVIYDLNKQEQIMDGPMRYGEEDRFGSRDILYIQAAVDGYLVGAGIKSPPTIGVIDDVRNWDGYTCDIISFYEGEHISGYYPRGGGVDSGTGGYVFFYEPSLFFDSTRFACCGLAAIGGDSQEHYLINVDAITQQFLGAEKYKDWGWSKCWVGDDYCVNIGKQFILWIETEAGKKKLLLNLENAQVGEAGIVEVSNVVKGVYDFVELNASGNYLASVGDDWFYVDSTGQKVADFKDCAAFWGGYSFVIEDDNQAYLVDANFNKVSQGYPADSVYRFGEALVFEKDGVATYVVQQ